MLQGMTIDAYSHSAHAGYGPFQTRYGADGASVPRFLNSDVADGPGPGDITVARITNSNATCDYFVRVGGMPESEVSRLRDGVQRYMDALPYEARSYRFDLRPGEVAWSGEIGSEVPECFAGVEKVISDTVYVFAGPELYARLGIS